MIIMAINHSNSIPYGNVQIGVADACIDYSIWAVRRPPTMFKFFLTPKRLWRPADVLSLEFAPRKRSGEKGTSTSFVRCERGLDLLGWVLQTFRTKRRVG
jgi:hypothetical protein